MLQSGNARVVLSRILPFIRERKFEPGDRIPSERDLAERFLVSRGVIREALSVLEAMRVVERRPQSGMYLREDSAGSLDALVLEADFGVPLNAADVRDLNEFRALIELQAVEIACARRTKTDIDRIDAILTQSKRKLEAGQSLSDQDTEFHLAICIATHNRILTRAANSFWLASKSRRDRYFANPANGRRSYRQHVALRNAIAAGDAAAARDVLRMHLGGVQRYWLKSLGGVSAAANGRKSRGLRRLYG